MVEEALKGTSYGAALEAAERDEQAKRDQKGGVDPQQAARRQAEDLRQAQMMARSLRNAPSPRVTDQEILSLLTRAKIAVLETGLKEATFPLSKWQIDTAAADLMAWKLIARHGTGAYSLTADGRRVHALWAEMWAPKSVTPDTTADTPITSPVSVETLTDNPLIDQQTPEDAPMTTALTPTYLSPTQVTILAAGVANTTFKLTPKQAGRSSGQLVDREWIRPTGKKGQWEITDLGRNAYETHLAEEAARNDQVYKQTESAINLDDPAPQTRASAPDFSQASSPDAQALGAVVAQRQIKINQLEKTVDDLGSRIDDLKQTIKTLEAGQAVTTRINWYEIVIAPLIDLMAAYDGEGVRLRVENDPSLIVQGVTGLSQAFDKVEDIVEERTKTIEQRDNTIESLRRCIQDLEAKLTVLQQEYSAVKRHDLSVIILDDLCHLIPEVEAYRAGREDADRALEALKLRR